MSKTNIENAKCCFWCKFFTPTFKSEWHICEKRKRKTLVPETSVCKYFKEEVWEKQR